MGIARRYSDRNKSPVEVGDVFESNQGCLYVVTEYSYHKTIKIGFLDDYKHERLVDIKSIRTGRIKNPYKASVCDKGFLGVGEHSSASNKHMYSKWKKMIERCYDPKKMGSIFYSDCIVCDEWLNYQNFAEWFLSQPEYRHKFDLDKDLLSNGIKIYSPSTCTLLPSRINSAIARNYKCDNYRAKVIKNLTSRLAMFLDIKAYNALVEMTDK